MATGLLDNRRHRASGSDAEATLDFPAVVPVAYQSGVRATTEQQPEPGKQHRLAGTGLAGHRSEAIAERQRRLVDRAETAKAQLDQHVPSLCVRTNAVGRTR